MRRWSVRIASGSAVLGLVACTMPVAFLGPTTVSTGTAIVTYEFAESFSGPNGDSEADLIDAISNPAAHDTTCVAHVPDRVFENLASLVGRHRVEPPIIDPSHPVPAHEVRVRSVDDITSIFMSNEAMDGAIFRASSADGRAVTFGFLPAVRDVDGRVYVLRPEDWDRADAIALHAILESEDCADARSTIEGRLQRLATLADASRRQYLSVDQR